MLMTNKEKEIVSFLKEEYPEAKATLIFHNPLECLLAILLSAQTTDKSVNQVTPPLFERFPTSKELANANVKDIENCIRSIGLYHNKARNIHALATVLEEKYGGRIPMKKEELMKLPGIGNKTAGVFLLEMGKEPYFPVDTHIKRISTRLGYAKKEMEPLEIEKRLEKIFPKEEWAYLHHAFIYFGRDICKAIHPLCEKCKLGKYCVYLKKHSSTTDR